MLVKTNIPTDACLIKPFHFKSTLISMSWDIIPLLSRVLDFARHHPFRFRLSFLHADVNISIGVVGVGRNHNHPVKACRSGLHHKWQMVEMINLGTITVRSPKQWGAAPQYLFIYSFIYCLPHPSLWASMPHCTMCPVMVRRHLWHLPTPPYQLSTL